MDADIKELVKILIEGKTRTDHSLDQLIRTVDKYVEHSNGNKKPGS